MRRISDFDDFYEAPIGLGGALELRDFGEEANSRLPNRGNSERGDIYRQTGRPGSTRLQRQAQPRWDRNPGTRENRVRGLVDFVSGPDADKNDDGIPDNYQTSDDRALAPSAAYEPFPGSSRIEDGIPLFGPGIGVPLPSYGRGLPTTSRNLDEQREKLRIRQEELERAYVIDEKKPGGPFSATSAMTRVILCSNRWGVVRYPGKTRLTRTRAIPMDRTIKG